jgi:hypothetical protein
MNNRIKQLIEQAEIKFESHPQHQGIDTAVIIPTDLEKFTELIVRECISIIEGIEPGYKDYRDQIEDAFRRDCVEEIKHKFGVEE